MNINPTIFRDYDIRAIFPKELDGPGAKRIAQSLVQLFTPKVVAIGHDMRLSADEMIQNLFAGFTSMGVDVVDLGLITTDMAYFAAGEYGYDLALSVSASHNPPEYNGLKIVKKGAVAVSGDSGIYELRDLAVSSTPIKPSTTKGHITKRDISSAWINHCLSFVKPDSIKPMKIVIDAGNGMAGYIIPKLASHLPQLEIIPLFFELDGSFPNHIPSPIEAKNMVDLQAKVKAEQADLGMAFDGDGDRVFLVDEDSNLISGTVMTAMIAEKILIKSPGSTILYNAICGRIVPETIGSNQGKAIRVRVGHTLIKEQMAKHDAIFAGEHSGHYYFKDNFKADSGLIAALITLEHISEQNQPLSQIAARFNKYPSSGEINFTVADQQAVMKAIETSLSSQANSIDWLDGISLWFDTWWANIRPSNTQPLLRLNVEADNHKLLREKTDLIIQLIKKQGGQSEA